MNDFQARTGLERTHRPLGFLQDQAVEFDSDAAGVQAQRLQQPQNRLAVGDLARFALDKDPHWI